MQELARRFERFELALVIVLASVVLIPGIRGYSLVDPWETHYGEVARMMLANGDWVHTEWPGSLSGDFNENEGFRSKPVLQFWMMAAGMRAVGVADHGGYSGELTSTSRLPLGIRLPFVLSAVAGLTLMWLMLRRLIGRRAAWLGLLVCGSTPMFCMIARTAIPDMPMTACTMGAVSLFALALEDGDRPIVAWWIRSPLAFNALHLVMALAGGFVVVQAVYYADYFLTTKQLAIRSRPSPALWLPLLMFGLLGLLHSAPWRLLQSLFRGRAARVVHLFGMARITTMRQVYLLGCYALLGLSVLAKGPPGLTVVGAVMVLHVVLLGAWRPLWAGDFEIKRGLVMMLVIFLPWHIAMFLKDGPSFINEYLFTHILNRAAVGVDNSPGTFEAYTSQIGHGMWLWASLLPAAVAAAFVRIGLDSRAGRVRFLIALWALVAVATFCLVQTKFHHYILPALPPLAVLVAMFLDDLVAKRERLHPLFAALGAGIVLLICRDLMFEPDRWIEMFVFRADRPWPFEGPYEIDPSSAFLVLGLVSCVALAMLATRHVRLGVAAVGATGLAICVWALQIYMPIAGTHWGMGDAARTYYQQRTIYGEHLIYFGDAQLADAWRDHGDTWSFDTVIPADLAEGQPMTLDVRLFKPTEPRVFDEQITLVGTTTRIGDHSIEITLAPGERAKLQPRIDLASQGKATRGTHPPIRSVAADPLIAFQLYWRGENFWSAEEILGFLPEQKTAFPNTNNLTEVTKYFADRSRSPFGRRYFVLGTVSQINGIKSVLPTERGRQTFEIVDATSNKFWLASFWL